MNELLDKTRFLAGPPPRTFNQQQAVLNHLEPPGWMEEAISYRGLDVLYREYEQLLTWGTVVWAYVIQANTLLFEKGEDDSPAAVVYSMDSYYDQNCDELGELANSLYEMKEMDAESINPELRMTAHSITNEYDCLFNTLVPDSLTQGRRVYGTNLMIHRKHLPAAYLERGYFPILAMPGALQSVMVLPSQYWDMELLTKWKETS
ncbi:MAG: hypothetical protein GY757_46320 [bacterium]|nr:hypothetical protein [bacterium]